MQIVDLFIDSLKSKHTKTKYAYHFERFEQYLPGARKLKAPDKLTESIISYLMQMKADGLSYSYRAVALAAVKHYYEMSDILLNWKKIGKFLGENQDNTESAGYSREDIQKLLKYADVKYRAVILLYASTGMRREALTQLKIKDFEYLDKYQLYKVKIYKNSKSAQISYTTPEAAEAIKLYIESKGLKDGDKFHDVEPKAVSTLLRNLAIQAGIVNHHSLEKDEEIGRFRSEVPAVHGLRKWCITQLARAKVDAEIAKLLTGHSIGVRGRYLNYSDEDLLIEFTKAIPLLTVGKEAELSNELKDLATKNESFVSSVDTIKDNLRQKDEQIAKLTELVEAIQKEQEQSDKELKEIVEDLEEFNKARIPEYKSEVDQDETKQLDKKIKEASAAIMKDTKKKKR